MTFGDYIWPIMHPLATRVFYENLPANYSLTDDWVVYSFNRQEQVDCLSTKNQFTYFTLTVKAISGSTERLGLLSGAIIDTLNSVCTEQIPDITFTNDDYGVDLERGLYSNIMTFRAIYV